ncbi:MAG: hypothetical protein JWR72_3672 [Flavisolibacter sp.]|nr:hypothetical protein [Flavisolibacter sp.]
MPDIISVISRRWKLIFLLTLLATAVAFIVSMLIPKQYVSTVTALPANSMLSDKARIFNNNIEGLYPEIGGPDELDPIEGTAKLDTVYIAAASAFHLAPHYAIEEGTAYADYKAAIILKKKTDIRRSAYGELKIKVWDVDPAVASQLANILLQKINEIHQHLQSANNTQILQKIRDALTAKQKELASIEQSVTSYKGGNQYNPKNEAFTGNNSVSDTSAKPEKLSTLTGNMPMLSGQVTEYQKLIAQYELAIKLAPQPLLAVEAARPSLWPDKPNVLQTTIVALIASLLFSFLLALLVDSRNKPA